jgi:AcrR family transcriptional regulator
MVQYSRVLPHTLQDRPTSASGRTRYAKSRETRARILAAALAEASDSGFHKTSVARIAARAGVAVGNLNYHFGSRSALLRELMGSLVVDLMSRLQAAASHDGADFFVRQRAEVIAYLEYLRANPAHLRLADEIRLHEPVLYRRAVAQWVERITQRLREGIDSGTLRAMDDTEIAAQAHFLLGARHFVEQMIEGGDGLDDEAVVDAYLGLIRDGLRRRPGDGNGNGSAS